MDVLKNPVPRLLNKAHHNIDVSKISDGANFVIRTLKSSGYDAFLVGGCVRDLILQNDPNDFDVVTNAKPNEIIKIFGRQSRPIGKRFKLVHVRSKDEVTEVSTFRRMPRRIKSDKNFRKRLIGDNEFGSISEDVFRRDFTINALYFDIDQKVVIDYVGGFYDLTDRKISCIGNPFERFEEDPMRILRAIRFATTLKLSMKNISLTEFSRCGGLLSNLSAARLFYELEKMFLRGSAAVVFNELVGLNLIHFLFPILDRNNMEDPVYKRSLDTIKIALQITDERVKMGQSANLAFLCAVILWSALKIEIQNLRCQITDESLIFDIAAENIISNQIKTIAIPRRVSNIMREIWKIQSVFENPTRRDANRLLQNRRLRAGYNFFVLRSKTEDYLTDTVDWWRKFFVVAKKMNKLPFPESQTYRL